MGAVCAAAGAYAAVRFLMGYLHTNRLTVFGGYCLAAGILAFAALQLV